MYNYLFYDPRRRELNGLSIFQFRDKGAALAARTYVTPGLLGTRARRQMPGAAAAGGCASSRRRATRDGSWSFPGRALQLEPPEYFATESPDADRMTYTQLRRYISDLRAGGFNVVPQTVALTARSRFRSSR